MGHICPKKKRDSQHETVKATTASSAGSAETASMDGQVDQITYRVSHVKLHTSGDPRLVCDVKDAFDRLRSLNINERLAQGEPKSIITWDLVTRYNLSVNSTLKVCIGQNASV